MKAPIGIPLTVALLLLALPVRGQDETCIDCHDAVTEGSIHEVLDCEDCHQGVDLLAHVEEELTPPFSLEEACGGCHSEEWDEHAASVHGLKINNLRHDEADCTDCHGDHDILPASNRRSQVHPANMINTCGRCHSNPELVKRHNIDILDPVIRYKQSVHYRVLESSGYTSATCNDCHGTHDIQNMRHSRSTINYWNVAETCGKCHVPELEDFHRSDHWLALQRGVRDAPACISCHGEHAITDPTGRLDHIRKREMADRTCLKCHSDEEIARKYGLEEGVATAYRDSYHGLAVSRGDEQAATCYDCHGVHAILGTEHDTATIHPNRLQETCARCHPNATLEFARSYTHASLLVREIPIEDIVATIYIALIMVVVGFMVVHNVIVFRGSVKARKRGWPVETTAGVAATPKALRRYSRPEVWQHMLLLVSFITLVITGFALKFADAGWVRLLGQLGLNETVRGIVHRVAASLLIATTVWHVGYLLASRWGRHHLRGMLPTSGDFRDFAGSMRDYLKGRAPRVKFPLFDYAEKIEYWALVWGTVVMGLTGFILWFPTILGAATPIWLIKVSEVVHYWEAWLATLAILVWHFFFVIFHPEEYPGSNVMWTGRMEREDWRQKHGGFYEELEGELARYHQGEIDYDRLTPFAQEALRELEAESRQAPG